MHHIRRKDRKDDEAASPVYKAEDDDRNVDEVSPISRPLSNPAIPELIPKRLVRATGIRSRSGGRNRLSNGR